MNSFLVLFCIFLFVTFPAAPQEVFSCGGFIKSNLPFDYNRIKVHLYTDEGNLKYETDCAPNNGYYMVPVYVKGKYVIKLHPPNGWGFEPDSFELEVDGHSDPCSKGEDINFHFRGFTVSGKVTLANDGTGLSGIDVTFLDSKQQELSTVRTKEGWYHFRMVAPGDYFVKLNDRFVCGDKRLRSVRVVDDSSTVKGNLEVTSFSLQGLLRKDGISVSEMEVMLYSSEKHTLSGCDPSAIKDFEIPTDLGAAHFLCKTNADADGMFTFPCVPPGQYFILPYGRKGGLIYDFSPKVMKMNITTKSFVFKEPFSVVGLSVVGSVLWKEKGAGVGEVDILLDDKLVTRTNSKGIFVLEKLPAGSHVIQPKKEDLEFRSLTIDISEKEISISPFVVERFRLCGRVIVSVFPASVPKLTQRKLLLTNARTKEVISLTTDSNGNFCRMISRGQYILEPQILPNERQAGISLTPAQAKVDVDDKPLSSVVFHQFKAKISGFIYCRACHDVHLQLLFNDEKIDTVITNVEGHTSFQFAHVLPGKYSVKIEDSRSCWFDSLVSVIVKDEDIHNIVFRQNGFLFRPVCSHDLTLKYISEVGADRYEEVLHLKRGNNSLCLPLADKFQFSVDSCHLFANSTFTYFPTDPPPVFTAVKHRVSFDVATEKNTDDVVVNLSSKLLKKPSELKAANVEVVASRKNNESTTFVHRFEFYAAAGEELKLVPSSSRLIFVPEFVAVTAKDSCLQLGKQFDGKVGQYLNGKITPPLLSVKITVIGDQRSDVELTTTSNENGEYTFGPFHSLNGLKVEAEKAGYFFEPVDGRLGHFKASKLSELTIEVSDDSGKPLSNVLVSISGSSTFKRNNLTDSDGKIHFYGMNTDEYFVRPVLKEYSFQPQYKIVKIEEGTSVVVKLQGTRVAFSCSGSVRYLNGEPAGGVVLEAFSEACVQIHEDDITTDSGTYRIRGLKPQCEYVLRVKPTNQVGRSLPFQHKLMIADHDQDDVNFTIFQEPMTMDIVGHIKTDSVEHLPSLTALLSEKSSNLMPVHRVPLHRSSFFFFPPVPMDKKTYVCQLECSLPNYYTKEITPQQFTFVANRTVHSFTFTFHVKRNFIESEISTGSYAYFFLALLIVLLSYYSDRVIHLLQVHLVDYVFPYWNFGATNDSTSGRGLLAKDSVNIPGSKKRSKLRKV